MIARKPYCFLLVIIALWLFSSCTTYQSGFITELKEPVGIGRISHQKLDSLQRKKEKLKDESGVIVQSLLQSKQNQQPFLAANINHLFENLQHQFRVDSAYHYFYRRSDNDSIKKDSYLKMIESANDYSQLFQPDKTIRRTINRGDRGNNIPKKALLKTQKFLWASPTRKFIKERNIETIREGSKCRFVCEKCKDNTNTAIYKTAGFVSEILGRLVATIHAKPRPEPNIERLMPRLQKWDIVIQKSPKRATDIFIPGFFGHSGIYLGDSLFVESIQKGVIYNNPYHFAEGEIFLVIRQKNLSEEQKQRMEEITARQIGKKYDFNFNNCSPDRMVCSELIYLVYENIQWQNNRMLGVHTLSPNDIVRTALENQELTFTLYFDQNQLVENPGREFIEDLLN